MDIPDDLEFQQSDLFNQRGDNVMKDINIEPTTYRLRRQLLSFPTVFSFVVVALLCIFLITRFNVDVGSTLGRIQEADPFLYVLAFLIYYTTFLFRGARWRLLLHNAGVAENAPLPSILTAGRLVLVGWMISSITWFRMGDAFRAYAYSRESGAPLARIVGTVVAERVLDVATVFVLLTIAFVVSYFNTDTQLSTSFLLVGTGLLVPTMAIVAIFYFFGGSVNQYLPQRLKETYDVFRQGTLNSFHHLTRLTVLSFLGWVVEIGRLYLVIYSMGLETDMGLIMFTMVANALLSAVPVTPGGLGIVETGMTGLLTIAMVREDALSVVLLDRSISYLSVLVFGSVAFAIHERARLRGRR
jgi:uncharacterized protein (TIRG00374 family)